jgi:Flp pilus assembly protein TadG
LRAIRGKFIGNSRFYAHDISSLSSHDEETRTGFSLGALVAMLLARFITDRTGGVAPLLALAIIPIMGAVAASVDYSRASAIRSAMQSSLDATALMLSKTAQGLSSTQLQDKATGYFTAVFSHPEAAVTGVTPNLTQPSTGNFALTVSGSATVNTLFAKILGLSSIDLTASSQVLWGIKKLNLALVLDNTGSMSQSGKMTALKTAAHNLLNTLQAAATTPGDIQVSIVPFALDVNVGTSNVSATWLDWTDWNGENGSCSKTKYTTQSSCTSNGKTWTADNHSTWNGCVMDRDQNNDVLNTAPIVGSTSTMFPANQAAACPTAMIPLSSNWTVLNSKVDAMTPTGNTNITIGLAWGWQTLTSTAPFYAPAPVWDTDRVIILLTDGLNTQNRWTTSGTSIDSRTQLACNNIKASGIKVYTVRVMDGDAALLQSCATSASMYYDVTDASQLNAVFSSIAQNLTVLRIAQ